MDTVMLNCYVLCQYSTGNIVYKFCNGINSFSKQLYICIRAVANFDYDSGVHIIPIPIGETIITYNFTIFDDDLFEFDETFKLDIIESSLHKKVNRKEPYTATITIINNDERE